MGDTECVGKMYVTRKTPPEIILRTDIIKKNPKLLHNILKDFKLSTT